MNDTRSKILMVDDETDMIEFMTYTLYKEGFYVLAAKNGQDAIAIAKRERPQLILLDIMMPEMDGIETCKELREIDFLRDVPIAFLTARNEDYAQIAGFNAGADDYIIKPVKPKVLLSRIAALLRRHSKENAYPEVPSPVSIAPVGGLLVDRDRYLVTDNGRSIHLRRREFELLSLLVSKPQKVFTREEILSRVWGSAIIISSRTVDVHMNQLREKVGDKYFMTIKGVGYKYIQ